VLGDPPTTLPAGLTSLSVSSIALLQKCPLRWRRRYIDGDYEPTSPAAILGHSVGRAEGTSYQEQISNGSRMRVSDVLDAYADEWELKVEEETDRAGVDWEDERPGRVKDSGARVLSLYHRTVAPRVRPLSVERRIEVALPGVEWTFRGYLDLEAEIGRVIGVDDFKARGASKGPITAEEAAAEMQPTGYLFAKRAEATLEERPHQPRFLKPPSYFRFHNFVRARIGDPRPANVVLTTTTRTEEQLDSFLALLYRVAAEIDWRVTNDVWTPAPAGSWWCAEKWCGFWATCPFGGAHRPKEAPAPVPVRRPSADQVIDAVKATARRDGTTTAARVGAHLGVSVRSAASSMTALARRGVLKSVLPAKRRKGSAVVHVYSVLDDGTVERQLRASVRELERESTGREAVTA
jgi:hypothetical protein